MNSDELNKLIKESKQEMDKIAEEFDFHSREFDKKINRILFAL